VALSYIQGDHRDWAASVIEDWHDVQVGLLKLKLKKSEREGIKSGIERTFELMEKLRDKNVDLSHEEWDDVLMYIWQERCD